MAVSPLKQTLSAVMILAMLVPALAWAEHGKPCPRSEAGKSEMGQRWEQKKQEMFAGLNLSEDQKARIKALMESKRNQGKPDFEAMRIRHQEMMQMLKSGTASREEALAHHREMAQQHNAMMEHRIHFLYDLKTILTPEQFAKVSERMQQMGDSHRPGHWKKTGSDHAKQS